MSASPPPTAELAAVIAEWMNDGHQSDDEYLTDAYALLETLRRKGWRFSVALGRADYTGRRPLPSNDRSEA